MKKYELGMVVHCKTEKEARCLLKYLKEMGLRWSTGTPISKKATHFRMHQEETCYSTDNILGHVGLVYGPKSSFQARNCKIVEFSDLDIASKLDIDSDFNDNIADCLSKKAQGALFVLNEQEMNVVLGALNVYVQNDNLPKELRDAAETIREKAKKYIKRM